MEAQLKSIEEKLDIIITAMSVNPEFSSFVKEGLMNLKIEKATKNFEVENNERFLKVRSLLIDYIDRFTEKYETFGSMTSFTKTIAFAPVKHAPLCAYEPLSELAKIAEQKGWDTKQIEFDNFINRLRFEDGFCPAFKIKLLDLFGKELNLDEEIEKIKQEAV